MATVFICLAFSSCTKSVADRYAVYNSKSSDVKRQIVTANGGKYDYDLSEYIVVPEFIGIEIPDVTYTATDEDVENMRYEKLAYFADEEIIADGTVEKYDLVVADYICTVDGLLYSGMCSQGDNSLRNFMVGVNEFDVREIDDALIGMAPGETKTVKFTFPIPYYKNVMLSGKSGEFTITIETIRRQLFDDYTDDFVAEHYGASSADSYDSTIAQQLEHDYGISLENYEIDMIWDYLSENITILVVPQKEYTEKMNYYMDKYETFAANSKMTVDEYVTEVLGYESVGDFRDALDEYVLRDIKETMAAHYIARCAGLYVTEEEYTNALLENAAEYGTDDITYCEGLAIDYYGSLSNFRENLLVGKVDNYLLTYSVKIDTSEFFEKKANGEYIYKEGPLSRITTDDVLVIVLSVVAVILLVVVAVLAVMAVKAKKERDKRVAERLALEEKRRLRREAKKAKKKHHTTDNTFKNS